MADTKDIWNDDDGEELTEKKRPRFRRFLIFFLTLVIVLAVVLVAAYRDGTGFDVLRRFFSYGGSENGGVEYHYDASSSNRFALLGETLVVLSGNSLKVLDGTGEEVWSTAVKMNAPALAVGGGYAVAYDVGGTELYVVSPEGEELSLTADEEEPYISATLNAEGWLAVTTEKRNYKGCVSVYNEKMEQIFDFNSSQRFVIDAYVTDDGSYLAAVTLGQEESVFVSNIVLYDLTKTDPVADYDIQDGLVLAIGGQDGKLVTVSDTCLTYANKQGEIQSNYSYAGEYLREYDLSGDGFAVLLLDRYKSGNVGRLVTVTPDGEDPVSLDVNDEVRNLSAAGRYIAVLYTDKLVIYNQDLQEYARFEEMDYAREVLMRSDGSVLVISAESAELFLP